MSALNEQLNSVEKREEYIENIPVNQGISNRCACCVFLIIVIFLDILFCVIFISDPKKNSWALAIAVIIDLPLGIYLRCCPHNTANSNSSPTYKKLKLFKDQNDMLVIDIDNAKYSYPLANVDKFSFTNENGYAIIIELFDLKKIKLINTCYHPSTLICHLNDHLNKLKVNITPNIY